MGEQHLKIRDSNVELMRIVCILLVIGGHYFTHGGWDEKLSSSNELFLTIWGGGSKLAVNCFVLITGYYGSNLKASRVIGIIRDRWFYSIALTIALIGFGITQMSGILFIKTLFPLLTCRHNYITVFVALYCFIPFINKFIDSLDLALFKKFLVISGLILSFISYFYPPFSNNTYAYLTWMCFLFCVGRYMKDSTYTVNWKIWFPISLLTLFVYDIVIEPKLMIYEKNASISLQNSFLLLIASICTVGIFTSIKIKNNRIINSLAKSTFAVYILHDDPDVRSYIWSQLFKNITFEESRFLWIHFFSTIFIIYITCILIDKTYRITFEKIMRMIPTKKLEVAIDKFYSA